MMAHNADDRLLTARRIDPRDSRSPLEQALRIGLHDEWHALATYEAVIARFGPVRPFVNIVGAEANHADAIMRRMARYGFALPVNDWAGRVQVPATLKECCAEGVAGEIENVAMYDDFLSYPLPEDVAGLFRRLKDASANHHLPAFQRCLARYGDASAPAGGGGSGAGRGRAPGQVRGQTQGQTRGQGAGRGRQLRAGQERRAGEELRAGSGRNAVADPAAISGGMNGKAGVALVGAAVLGLGALGVGVGLAGLVRRMIRRPMAAQTPDKEG